MAHQLIEAARNAPLNQRTAAMRRARAQVKRELVLEAKQRAKAGKNNWSTKYRDLDLGPVPTVEPFAHYQKQVQREATARRRRRS